MARIALPDAQGWAESTKMTLPSLDSALLNQLEAEILARLTTVYDTTTWLDELTTPLVIKVIIAKTYVAWVYNRQYSENQNTNNDYAAMLLANAEALMTGLISGVIDIPGVSPIGGIPSYYPNDASSSQLPTWDDPSLGPSKFSMGQRF